MSEDVSLVFLLAGSIFIFLGSLGLIRMPDLFMRMHASTKSATLGILLVMFGVMIYFSNLTVTTRAMAVVVFVFLTVPVGAHFIGRAAYFSGVPLWEKTAQDELSEYYLERDDFPWDHRS